MATPTAPQLNKVPLQAARALWLAVAVLGCEEPAEPDLLLSSGLDGGAFPMELGAGERAFAPLAEDQVLPYVSGPQGGEHVFVAFRMSDLDPKRVLVTTTTTIEGFENSQTSHRGRVNFEPDEAAASYVYAGFPAVIEEAYSHTGERTRIDVVLEDPVGRHASASQTIVIGE